MAPRSEEARCGKLSMRSPRTRATEGSIPSLRTTLTKGHCEQSHEQVFSRSTLFEKTVMRGVGRTTELDTIDTKYRRE